MSHQQVNNKGSLDLEQPPHVANTSATTYTPPPPQADPPPPPPAHLQTVPGFMSYINPHETGHAVVDGVAVAPRERLPCCGLGFGWTLFIVGFFITIPWYAGSVLLCYVIHKKDYREKPGCIACLVGAVLITALMIVKFTTGQPHWL